jgi:hypothetical protein
MVDVATYGNTLDTHFEVYVNREMSEIIFHSKNLMGEKGR